ncbi:DUF2269 family protein [Legionella tunisiensis]
MNALFMAQVHSHFKLYSVIWHWIWYSMCFALWALYKNISTMAVCNQYVVLVDWLFTGISGFVQALTGLWMVYLAGYSFQYLWIWGAIAGYILAACCWFPVVYFQIKLRDIVLTAVKNKTPLPAEYFYYFRRWFILGWPAFLSLLIVFYFMVMKPILNIAIHFYRNTTRTFTMLIIKQDGTAYFTNISSGNLLKLFSLFNK